MDKNSGYYKIKGKKGEGAVEAKRPNMTIPRGGQTLVGTAKPKPVREESNSTHFYNQK